MELAAAAGDKSLLPSIEQMADSTKSTTLWEAHHLVYRYLSAWEHHEHGTFNEVVTETELVIEDSSFEPLQVRLLAATITAALIAVVGLATGLPLVEPANRIRDRLLVLPPALGPIRSRMPRQATANDGLADF